MKLVGLSTGAHDVGYAILENGIPILHYELERYNRQKECFGDALGCYLQNPVDADEILAMFMQWQGGIKTLYPDSWNKAKDKYEIKFINHHLAHAANAYYSSNFNDSVIITLDGGGEELGHNTAFCVFYAKENKIGYIYRTKLEDINIGGIWDKVASKLLPKGVGNQSGTLMAMAAYGEPKYDVFGGYLEGNKFDICASLQEQTYKFIEDVFNKYKHLSNNFCFAGGCALNSAALGKLVFNNQGYNFFVPYAPYDAGLVQQNLKHILQQNKSY